MTVAGTLTITIRSSAVNAVAMSMIGASQLIPVRLWISLTY